MLGIIVLCLIIAIIIANSIVIVPTVNFGIVVRFKRRTGRILSEGANLIMPFIDDVELYSVKLSTTPIAVKFFSKDKLEISIKGSMQWRPDPKLLLRFIELSEEAVTEGINDAVKSVLGEIAGVKPMSVFIGKRRNLEKLINCILRLEKAPHLAPRLIDEASKDEIAPANRLAFYEKHSKEIRALLEKELQQKERSMIEKHYGIDIAIFILTEVGFSEETEKALEKRQQVKAELEAVQVKANRIVTMSEKFKAIPVSPEKAADMALVAAGLAEKKIHVIEGFDSKDLKDIARSILTNPREEPK